MVNLTATIYTEDDRAIVVTGTWNKAEPGNGIPEPYVEVEGAELDGAAYDLAKHERDRAEEALFEAHERAKAKDEADCEDAQESARELRQERERTR